MNDIFPNSRTITVALLAGAGLFMIAIAPFLVQSTLRLTLQASMEEAAADPSHASGPNLVAVFSLHGGRLSS